MLIILKIIIISLLCFNNIFSQKVEFPSKFKILKQSPFWIDWKDLAKIKIGMDKNEIIKKIGHPIQIYEIKDKQNDTYIYRAREFGYIFLENIKPRLSKNSFWTDSSYYLYFTYNNGKLKEIKSEHSYFRTPIQNYQYLN